jgi:hypothetical protein
VVAKELRIAAERERAHARVQPVGADHQVVALAGAARQRHRAAVEAGHVLAEAVAH